MTTGYRHGVYQSEKPAQLLPARTVDSNVVFAVGLAAVHTLAADKPVYVNVPRLFYSYDEFVQEMGWDDDNFSAFTLQELVYSHFSLYRAAPLVVVNVFDPARTRRRWTAKAQRSRPPAMVAPLREPPASATRTSAMS